jgi:threonine/homoserine/homoserine lactone efflux protein
VSIGVLLTRLLVVASWMRRTFAAAFAALGAKLAFTDR